jgi:hypothetical protein
MKLEKIPARIPRYGYKVMLLETLLDLHQPGFPIRGVVLQTPYQGTEVDVMANPVMKKLTDSDCSTELTKKAYPVGIHVMSTLAGAAVFASRLDKDDTVIARVKLSGNALAYGLDYTAGAIRKYKSIVMDEVTFSNDPKDYLSYSGKPLKGGNLKLIKLAIQGKVSDLLALTPNKRKKKAKKVAK